MNNIAIVEDDRITRESLEAIINHSPDFRCVGACATAEEALKRIPALRPEVVLMDIQLPKMSGVECVAKLKEALPSVQVIMVTVYEDAERIFCALRAGASGYLLKRSTAEQVLNGIHDVLQGGVPMTGGIARKVISHFHEEEAAKADVAALSVREREVLDLLVAGLASKEIAERLGVSVPTVRWHLRSIYQQLHVHSRVEAVLKVRPRK